METIGDIRRSETHWLEVSCMVCTGSLLLAKGLIPKHLPNEILIADAGNLLECPHCETKGIPSEMICAAMEPLSYNSKAS